MRKSLWIMLACLALPLAASADSIGIATDGGTIAATSSTLSLSGDVMTMYGAISGTNLGTVTFTTGAFESGSVAAGGTLSAGGTFTVNGNGSVVGVPSGVIFTGIFDSGTWTFDTATSSYTFKGDVTGSDGTATITELTLSGTLNPGGTISAASGDIVLSTPTTAPEPASLLLLGSGLLGVAGIKRRRSGR